MKENIRRICLALCTLLAVAVAVLGVRSFWCADEIGYYTFKPVPGQPGLDRRQLIGSWRGGLFWLATEADAGFPNGAIDWGGGEPIEIIARDTTDSQLALAALGPANATVPQPVLPVPRWALIGFNLRASSGGPASKALYRLVVVPSWALFLVLSWPASMVVRRRWIARYRRKHRLCLNCGYDLRSSSEVCSECGQSRAEPAPATVPPRRAMRWAIAAACAVFAVGVAWLWPIQNRGRHPEPAVRLDPGAVLSADHLPQRVELDLGKGVTLRLALIPAGHFLMGSPSNEANRGDDETQHEVVISKPFYMGITTVTQEQYEAVTGGNPSYFKRPRNPVETVSWDDAMEFCRKLSDKTGRTLRLPSEAQWEYACRAGTTTAFNTGATLPRDMANYAVGYGYPANRIGDSAARVLPVGSFPTNAWGLYDMHGNVWQWCADAYGEYHKTQVADPTGAADTSSRVLRGGSWSVYPHYCRAGCRLSITPHYWANNVGFRLVLDF